LVSLIHPSVTKLVETAKITSLEQIIDGGQYSEEWVIRRDVRRYRATPSSSSRRAEYCEIAAAVSHYRIVAKLGEGDIFC
jgi:hypothetical protein